MSRTASRKASPEAAPPAFEAPPHTDGSGTSLKPSTRDAIMRAALELFGERGFHGVAVPEVAQRAGVATGSIYRHFPSKEALANAVYQHWRRQQLRALFQDFPTELSHRQQFHEAWMRQARFYLQNPAAFAFLELQNHNSYLSDDSRAARDALLDPTLNFLATAQQQHVVKDLPPRLLLAITNGAFLGVVKFSAANHFPLTEEVLAAAEQCCWEAVRR